MREHLEMIESREARGVAVKRPSGLDGLDGLVIPGGESTTIGKLIEEYGFCDGIRRMAGNGVPILGTYAGMILMAKRVNGRHGSLLGLADITVERNAFGRQVDSFETDLFVRGIEQEERPFRAVFIRAPLIKETGPGVEELATINGSAALIRDRRFLLGAFHPELAGDSRIHRYFVNMITSPGDMEVSRCRVIRSGPP